MLVKKIQTLLGLILIVTLVSCGKGSITIELFNKPQNGETINNSAGNNNNSNITYPSRWVDFGGRAKTLKVVGNRLYVNKEYMGLEIYDISDESNPIQIGAYRTTYREINDIAVSSDHHYAYLSEVTRIITLDISDLDDIKVKNIQVFTNTVSQIQISSDDSTLYFCNESAGLKIADLSSSGVPSIQGSYNTPGSCNKFKLSTDEEFLLLAKSGSKIAHCPTSNAPVEDLGLGSGLFDIEKANHFGVEWGLGSDIGGGPYLSMFDVMESFVTQHQKAGRDSVNYTKALYRSTLKNAEILGLDSILGSFEKGKEASFIFVENSVHSSEEAEKVLKDLISPLSKRRKKMDKLVRKTYFKGNCIFE